ncbi:3-hydroxyacyl-CoA dehydrogenase NAD-binding domain-containing protein [Minwuia thermotolerans]|uniref:3-hydroxyacyl-CoA dehydrogenase n=1 Tax=Minwuia thermotolerans TaxID=2056226 RepID=A0A2M9G3V7_9PROT|nr:3-hydroxyacyl-CoA dehydrogenase NAD-binding domain-containing protein [Minwuia thermotolerans]PJK30393.1 3-hydroxyacyl-CoA dehydrogenase [Minwuia thermotolerans]
MSSPVVLEKHGSIGVILVQNPPVNALSQAVRQGLADRLAEAIADDDIKGVVLAGDGRTFIAGADIREFGKPMQAPDLNSVIRAYEESPKPVVAAIHGTALGGGLETAFAAHYRVAVAKSFVGLPEVKLGLLPGAGGTQRLPRVAGVKTALDMITSGDMVPAPKAREAGIVDEIVDDLIPGAVAFAEKLVAEGAPLKVISAGRGKLDEADPAIFDEYRAQVAKKARGVLAPQNCIAAVEAAVKASSFEDGLKRERELFAELMESPQRAAQIHIFFGEREVAKIPDLPKGTEAKKIGKVAIIGCGTMGGGIAMNFANVGIPVTIVENEQAALDRGFGIIRKNYENSAKRGRFPMDEVEKRMGRLTPTTSYDDIADADIVIEAVFEEMGLKKEIFAKLDQVMKPGAVLATNTSTLDIDEIASATKRPEDVIGTHFFSPANVMRLLENVRGEKSSPETIQTVMDMGKKIGKVAVLAGNCHGFIGNRMLHPYRRQAEFLVEEGAQPEDIDRVIYDFGFAMGPFAMGDLAGLDVGYRVRQHQLKTWPQGKRYSSLGDKIVEMGRHGQKTGAGWFLYEEGDRTPKPDPVIKELIEKHAAEAGLKRRAVSDEEILERCIYALVNEGAKILEEGIAIRPVDIDITYVYGYAFPKHRGGPMHYADHVGLDKVLARIRHFHEISGEDEWKPAKLIEDLVAQGKGFKDFTR